jgi:hypothetical protein
MSSAMSIKNVTINVSPTSNFQIFFQVLHAKILAEEISFQSNLQYLARC